jgi:S-formylglutathione hydrolase FrmB
MVSSGRRTAIGVTLGATLLAVVLPWTAPEGAAAAQPASYGGADATVVPDPDHPGALAVEFTSRTLGRRVHNAVYLPSSYRPGGPASPVLYYLHGTLIPGLDQPAFAPESTTARRLRSAALFSAVGPGGAQLQTDLQNFAAERDRARFIVAVPDTGDPAVCQTCVWIDGQPHRNPNLPPVTAQSVAMETFLYEEFVPLIEHLFNARTDAAGRGLTGFSMGGLGTWLQAMRHPDRFAFVAPISGAYDIQNDPVLRYSIAEPVGYQRDQGYGTSVTDSTQWARVNPAVLVQNIVGADLAILVSAGDGCLAPSAARNEHCRAHPAPLNPDAGWVESVLRNDADRYAVPSLTRAGVEATQIRIPGVHGANNAEVYARYVVPAANAAFARPRKPAPTFSFTSADHTFAVWGYQVETGRQVDDRFTTLTSARRDGQGFTIRGQGPVTVTTPAAFAAGKRYDVTVREDGSPVDADAVRADQAGRLHIRLPAGSATTDRAVTVAG